MKIGCRLAFVLRRADLISAGFTRPTLALAPCDPRGYAPPDGYLRNPALTRRGFVFLHRRNMGNIIEIGCCLADALRRANLISAGFTRPTLALALCDPARFCATPTRYRRVAPALRLFNVAHGGARHAASSPIGKINAMPNPAMERRPPPINSSVNKPMLHRVGVQVIHMLSEVSFIPNKVLPKTVLP